MSVNKAITRIPSLLPCPSLLPQDPFLGDVTGWGYQGLQPHRGAGVGGGERVLDKLGGGGGEGGGGAARGAGASGAGMEAADGIRLL